MELQTAKGVRDLPPEEKILKNKVVGTITKIFELYGFAPLETLYIRTVRDLSGKIWRRSGKRCAERNLYPERSGRKKVRYLKFEMTTSLARYVAQNPTIKMPFKVYQAGSVFRDGTNKIRAGKRILAVRCRYHRDRIHAGRSGTDRFDERNIPAAEIQGCHKDKQSETGKRHPFTIRNNCKTERSAHRYRQIG